MITLANPVWRGACVLLVFLACGCGRALAEDDCLGEAARYHKVNDVVLRAIAMQESGMRPRTQSRNANGTDDIGMMGINSVHLPMLARHGISRGALLDACINAYVAAWYLRGKILKHGNSWQAVGAYHSETPALRDAYAQRIRSRIAETRP